MPLKRRRSYEVGFLAANTDDFFHHRQHNPRPNVLASCFAERFILKNCLMGQTNFVLPTLVVSVGDDEPTILEISKPGQRKQGFH